MKGTIDAHGLEIVEKKNEIMTNNRSMDYDWGKEKKKANIMVKNNTDWDKAAPPKYTK